MHKNLQPNDFLNKQRQIYTEFKKNELDLKSFRIVPNPKILNGQSGYLIALSHPDNILKIVEETSYKINELTESIIYRKHNIHTTITTYLQKDSIEEPTQEILDLLADVLQTSLRGQKFEIEINFRKFLYNQDSVIAAGYPNEDFISLSNEIVNNARSRNIELRFPKMAHITVSRFIKNLGGTKQLGNFITLMNKVNEHQIGVSKANKLLVGHFTTTPKGFDLKKFQEFSL